VFGHIQVHGLKTVTYDENFEKEAKGPKEYLRQEVRQATNTEITNSWKSAYFLTNITQSLMDDTEYSKTHLPNQKLLAHFLLNK